MNTTVTLDKAGRVVIPKTLRDELHLEAGDSMALEFEGQSVTLRPLRSAAPLKKVRGVWVFHGSRKIAAADTDRVLERFRADRDWTVESFSRYLGARCHILRHARTS